MSKLSSIKPAQLSTMKKPFLMTMIGCCAALSMAVAAQDDKVIYREDFPGGQNITAAGWRVAWTGKQAPEVSVVAEEGAPTGSPAAPPSGGDRQEKPGHLLVKPGEPGQTLLYWTAEKDINPPQGAVVGFRWRQCFEKGGTDKVPSATPLRPAFRIGTTWYEGNLGYHAPIEPDGQWEEKTCWIDGNVRWSEWKLDGDSLQRGNTRWGGLEWCKLPPGPITGFGLISCAAGPQRIDSFEAFTWGPPKSPEVPADVKGSWPQFKRNSHRSGDAPEESLDFPLNRVAAVKLPHPIYASPAVAGGKVFVQDAAGNVVCFDYTQNKVVWLAKLEGVANHSSPAVKDGKVYIGSSAGYLAVLDARDGRVLKKVPGEGGVITAPAITENGIYFTTFDGKLVKINPEGAVIWTHTIGTRSIVEFAVRGDRIVVCGGGQNHDLQYLLDEGKSVKMLSGLQLWHAHCGPVYGPWGRVALGGYMSEGAERYVLALDDSKSVWIRRYGFNEWNSGDFDGQNNTRAVPSIHGERLFHGDICYDLNGRELWRVDTATSSLFGGGYNSSPALTRDQMVIGSEDGNVYFLLLDPKLKEKEGNKPVWTYKTGGAGKPNGAVSSSPAVADSRVFFGGEDGTLYVLGKGQEQSVVTARVPSEPAPQQPTRANNLEWPTIGGDMGHGWVSSDTTLKPPLRIKWKTRIWSTTKGPVIVADGLVFMANRLGEVHALDADTGRIVWRYSHLGPESIPSPTYAEGKLLIFRCASTYVPRQESLGLWCHDAKTGNVLWHKPMVFAYHHPSDGLVVVKSKVFIPMLKEGKLSVSALSLDTGQPVWGKTYDDLLYPDFGAWMRFSVAYGDGRVFVSVTKGHDFWQYGTSYPRKTGATMAVDPETGTLIWSNRDYSIDHQTRMMYRKNTLLVFDTKGGHALDPSKGKWLWDGPGMNKTAYQGCYFFQPLSDAYIESQGKRGVVYSDGCLYPVFINGLWYGHVRAQGHALVARREVAHADENGVTVSEIVWQQPFLGRACPSPAPAYGRLYFSPNSEGVVYCFENENQEQPK